MTLALVPLAALRLTRFMTTDWLGEWLFVKKIRQWGWKHEKPGIDERLKPLLRSGNAHVTLVVDGIEKTALDSEIEQIEAEGPKTWQGRLAKGFDCPFCIGFWLGLALVVISLLVPKPLRIAWNAFIGALGLNYVVGHISKRIDG